MRRAETEVGLRRGPILVTTILAVALTALPAEAQSLSYEDAITVALSDGTTVKCLPAVRSDDYYYLPTNLRLATDASGTPDFLFLKFTTEEREGASGALLHFLMEWGLTPAQESELQGRLEERREGARLMGAAPLEPAGESGTFRIVSATLSDEGLAPAIVTSEKAPLLPGGKVAAASRLGADGAQLLASTFEDVDSITDVSVVLDLAYTTLTPAARGTITFDWSRAEREFESLNAEYQRRRTGTQSTTFLGITIEENPTYSYSYEEMREQYQLMIEREIVKVEFEELVSDERVATIREAFFQYFLNTLTEAAEPEGPPPAPAEEEEEQSPNIRYGNSYRFRQATMRRAFERRTQRLDLSYQMAIKRPLQLVANLGSWYDSVSSRDCCIQAVNLNDPFFQHRDIRFILDLDAKEMFDEVVNYVTVNVRKRRSSGNDFADRITIDADYVESNGLTASVTYARGEDSAPDAYEYQARWSLKGGHEYPREPAWTRGTWEGVTLAPPVRPRTIEVEADLADLEASDITRATVQIRYPMFGQEREQNIHVSPARGEPLVEQRIFLDPAARGYAYRVVLNHKEAGKLALDWSPLVGDDYIYVSIPPELLGDPTLLDAARAAARDTLEGDGGSVLERFRDVIWDEREERR